MKEPEFELIRSSRKTISIQIKADGSLLVRAPLRTSRQRILAFLEEKRDWIEKHSAARKAAQPARKLTREELSALGSQAADWFPERTRLWAGRMGITYGRMTIRAQHTRWGSCSAQGNLNFNCLLMLAPVEVRDYVIIHELSHRREMNHSPAFWTLVEHWDPTWKQKRAWLKEQGGTLIAMLPK